MKFGIVYHNFKGKERIEEGKKKPPTSASASRRDLEEIWQIYTSPLSRHGWKMVILGNEPSLVFPKWVKVIFWLSAYSYSAEKAVHTVVLVDLLIKWAGHISTLLSQFQNKGELINERKFRNFPSTILSSSIYIYVH